MVELPFFTSHVDSGVPGLLFSHATGLPPTPHTSTVAAAEIDVAEVTHNKAKKAIVVTSAALRMVRLPCMGGSPLTSGDRCRLHSTARPKKVIPTL